MGRDEMSKQTRRRELERLRARREAERQRARRRRALLTYGGLGLVVVVAAVAAGLRLTADDTPAGAAATTVASPTTAPSGPCPAARTPTASDSACPRWRKTPRAPWVPPTSARRCKGSPLRPPAPLRLSSARFATPSVAALGLATRPTALLVCSALPVQRDRETRLEQQV